MRALVHDGDAIGDFERLFLIVRDENAGDVHFVVQLPQPAAQLLAHFGVERAERLVQQQHARLDGQRASQRDALALAAGELRREAPSLILQLDQVEQLVNLLADLRIARRRTLARPHAQAEGDVFEDRHVPEERVMLEDESDVALAGRSDRLMSSPSN